VTRCVTLVGDSDERGPHELYRMRVNAGLSLDEAAHLAGLFPRQLGDCEHHRCPFTAVEEQRLRVIYAERIANPKRGAKP
jgi:hypothetical protein